MPHRLHFAGSEHSCRFRSVQIPACLLSITLSTLRWESALGLKELSLQSRARHFEIEWFSLPAPRPQAAHLGFTDLMVKVDPCWLPSWADHLVVCYLNTTWNKGLYITGYLWYIGNRTKQKAAIYFFYKKKKQHWFPAPHVINSWISGLAHMFQWFLWEGAMYNDKILPDCRLHFIAVRKSNIKKSTCFFSALSSIQLG